MKKTIVVAAALSVSCAFADKLLLKSGSFLTGKATGASNGELTFKSDDLGEIKVKLENIERLEDAGDHVIRYNDNSRETKALGIDKGAWVLVTDEKPLDMGSVKEIDPAAEKWHGRINGAFLASRGNTVENSWSLIANLNKRWFWQDVPMTAYFWGVSLAFFLLGRLIYKRLKPHFADVL